MSNIKQLIADLKKQAAAIETELERALQYRERIASTPIPKTEVLHNLFSAIDSSAAEFEKQLKYIIGSCARKRHGTGIQKSPEVIREICDYAKLNTDSINYFFGYELKAKLENFIVSMEWPGGDEGLTQAEYSKQLADADATVDKIKAQRDELLNELRSIGDIDFV